MGHTVVVVGNPGAQDGKIGEELPALQRILEGNGARVVFVETVPDLEARRDLIQTEIREVFDETPADSFVSMRVRQNIPKIIVLPYGGDWTIWETVGETVKAAGIPLSSEHVSRGVSRALRSQVAFALAKKGKAADNASQVDAPKSAGEIARYINRSVELPYWFPIIETSGEQGPRFEVAGHSYTLGVSGDLFHRRETNKAENPDAWWNRGLKSYFRLLPHAIANRYGLLGMEVGIRHFNPQGELLKEANLIGSEIMVTPNRIVAAVGGIPGEWCETKLIVLPPAFRGGLLPLGEYIYRGVFTQLLGWNKVSPRHSLQTLSEDRQWRVRPGERIEVETRVPATLPESFYWSVLRMGQQTFQGSTANGIIKWMGFGKPGPTVPEAGEPLRVQSTLNGDAAPPQSRFTIHSPSYAISLLAHPDSLAVRLARESALAKGIEPLISDQQLVAHSIPEDEPRILEKNKNRIRVRTPFISQPRLWELTARSQFNLSPEVIPELMVATQGVQNHTQLEKLAQESLDLHRMQDFLESSQGNEWLRGHQGYIRGLGRRAWQQGVPLGVGIASLFGGEALADQLGLDPVRDRELRFALIMYLAHGVHTNVTPLWEVIANRSLGRPYDLVRTRSVKMAGETLNQYALSRHRSLGGALAQSWRTGALALEVGVGQGLAARAGRLALVPLRGAWNMGHGLIFSRVAEAFTQDLPDSSLWKQYGPLGAFFLPDLGSLFAPRSTQAFLQGRPGRFAGRTFAAFFIGDMAYTGFYKLTHGSSSSREIYLNHRASQLRRQRGDSVWWRDAIRFMAPNLGAHIDSHENLFGPENQYRREAFRAETQRAENMEWSLRHEITSFLHQRDLSWEKALGQRIELSAFETELQDHLRALGPERAEHLSWSQTLQWLRNEFSGYGLSAAEVETHLTRIYLGQVQESIAYQINFPSPKNWYWGRYFDAQGRIKAGRGRALEEFLASSG